jgi:hypothetical protein
MLINKFTFALFGIAFVAVVVAPVSVVNWIVK